MVKLNSRQFKIRNRFANAEFTRYRFSNVCDIYVCYMLNKITYLLTDLPHSPLDDERQRRSGSLDNVLGLLLLHPTDVMVVDGSKNVSTLQTTIRRTATEHLHKVNPGLQSLARTV